VDLQYLGADFPTDRALPAGYGAARPGLLGRTLALQALVADGWSPFDDDR
jgi:hypothetical protein